MADAVVMLEVYSAGEEPIPGADSRALCRAIRTRGKVEPIFAPGQDELVDVLGDIIAEDDVVLVLGAGNIGRVVERFEFLSPVSVESGSAR